MKYINRAKYVQPMGICPVGIHIKHYTNIYNQYFSYLFMANSKDKIDELKGQPEMSQEEVIGFHKGSIQTLINERNELVKIIQITEALIKAHVEELKKLGVEIK